MSSDEFEPQLNENELYFRKILTDQFTRYPKMEIKDLYKLIHQGVMGSEHAVRDAETAQSWLEEEIKNLRDESDKPITDSISPSGEIVRINVRPYIRSRDDLDSLLKAFIRTANEFHGSTENLCRYWSYAERMVEEGNFDLDDVEMKNFISRMKLEGFPAMHHSELYEESYHPAYRVVAILFLSRKQSDWTNSG